MSIDAAEFMQASVRTATPLALAAYGELVVERAGVINLGLEGAMIAGAFGALVGASAGGIGAGFAMAVVAGCAATLLMAWVVLWLRADAVIAGTAVTLLALGLTGTLYRALYGAQGAALSVPTLAPVAVPGLHQLPWIGPAFFEQPLATYALYAMACGLWWWLPRTHAGLALRATGERPDAALAAGISPVTVRAWALLFGGAMGGLAGGVLVLAQVGTFAEGMSAGRGFIAIAIVVLGRWSPVGVALAALLFGSASQLQYVFQSLGWPVPYQLFLALPYVLTLLVLAGTQRRAAAPASLGAPLDTAP
ncbi:MAG: ABC transporter permease [Gemmatimonadota bacterium]|nr:ABC transporter permease [Gemmatimonadota bacterium]